MEAAVAAGLAVDEFAPRLSFFFNSHSDFFEEVGKFRAARRIWARWLRDRYGATDERSLKLRFHTQTAGVSLTAQQPEVNIARVALQALAGVLGGTQQVIAHETGVTGVADPLGGSTYVEWMTDELERRAEEVFSRLEEEGAGSILEGVLVGIDSGWFMREIAESAYRFEREVNAGERIIVGVNAFTEGDEGRAGRLLRIDQDTEDLQRKRLDAVRRVRDDGAVRTASSRRRGTARGQPAARPRRGRPCPRQRR